MKESHSKDPASHADPESCGAVREDGSEALTGADAGEVLSHEIDTPGMPTQLSHAEGNNLRNAMASSAGHRRGRRSSACVEASWNGTGRPLHSACSDGD